MSKVKTLFANAKKPLAAVVVGVASSSAMAVDYTDQISAAVTDGSTNVTAVIAGCITVAVIGFGVGHMLGWFKK